MSLTDLHSLYAYVRDLEAAFQRDDREWREAAFEAYRRHVSLTATDMAAALIMPAMIYGHMWASLQRTLYADSDDAGFGLQIVGTLGDDDRPELTATRLFVCGCNGDRDTAMALVKALFSSASEKEVARTVVELYCILRDLPMVHDLIRADSSILYPTNTNPH